MLFPCKFGPKTGVCITHRRERIAHEKIRYFIRVYRGKVALLKPQNAIGTCQPRQRRPGPHSACDCVTREARTPGGAAFSAASRERGLGSRCARAVRGPGLRSRSSLCGIRVRSASVSRARAIGPHFGSVPEDARPQWGLGRGGSSQIP